VANALSSFYQTLVTAASEASQALVGSNAFLDSVYLDYKPEAASIGQTLNVPIPSQVQSSVADGGVADPTFSNITFTTEPIVFSMHPAYNYIIRDFEQFNSPVMIRQIFLDAAIKGVAMYIDQQVANLFTTTNFNVNTNITGTGSGGGTSGDSIAVKDFMTAQAALLQQLVEVRDPQNITLLQHPVPWSWMNLDSNWVQQSIASELVAERVRLTGSIQTAFGATLEQDVNTYSTGSSPSRTFYNAYFHRWAVAVATRPLPPPDAKVADFTYIMYKGIPLRITLAWSVIHNGYCVLVEAGVGMAVVRPNMGVLISTTPG
jgi:hypothetical protein